MLAPALVDDLQQQEALEIAHQLLAELLLAPVVERERLLLQLGGQLFAIDAVRVDVGELCARSEDLRHAR